MCGLQERFCIECEHHKGSTEGSLDAHGSVLECRGSFVFSVNVNLGEAGLKGSSQTSITLKDKWRECACNYTLYQLYHFQLNSSELSVYAWQMPLSCLYKTLFIYLFDFKCVHVNGIFQVIFLSTQFNVRKQPFKSGHPGNLKRKTSPLSLSVCLCAFCSHCGVYRFRSKEKQAASCHGLFVSKHCGATLHWHWRTRSSDRHHQVHVFNVWILLKNVTSNPSSRVHHDVITILLHHATLLHHYGLHSCSLRQTPTTLSEFKLHSPFNHGL